MNFLTYNQDYSCLAVGTSKGFRIYHTDPFSKMFSSNDGNISIVEMLFSTSLVALIISPRRLVISNTKKDTVICELTFPGAVLAVRLNRKRLAVVLEECIYLYDISNMSLLANITTSPNPNAICALSASSENCYLVYPLPNPREESDDKRPQHSPPSTQYVAPTCGDVLIYDALEMKPVNVIGAHKSPLSCVALNNSGTLLATASATGTVIRVFEVPSGKRLYQFRRGTYPATIYSISINLSSTLLCVSSATDTVHIFRLRNPQGLARAQSTVPSGPDLRERSRSCDSETGSTADGFDFSASSDAGPESLAVRKSNGTLGSMIRRSSQMMGKSVAGVVGGYLPAAVTEIWDPQRDFAFVKIPKASVTTNNGPVRSVVAMSNSSPQVMLVTSDGSFYVFSIDMETGGEGVLVKQASLHESDDNLDRSSMDYGS